MRLTIVPNLATWSLHKPVKPTTAYWKQGCQIRVQSGLDCSVDTYEICPFGVNLNHVEPKSDNTVKFSQFFHCCRHSVPDPPEKCHLNVKNCQKLAFFLKLPKIAIFPKIDKVRSVIVFSCNGSFSSYGSSTVKRSWCWCFIWSKQHLYIS